MPFQSDPATPGLLMVAGDGSVLPIHPLWLRERCSDPAWLDPVTRQRLYNPSDLDPDLAVVSVEPEGDSAWLLRFSDGAAGVFTAAGLEDDLPAERALPARRPWSSTLMPLPRFTIDGDKRPILEAFLELGFVILTGVPCHPGSVLDVARGFGFPRETNFGTLFDVRSVPSASDLAYTALALDPHTDNPYRDPVPGVQLLHCLRNETRGGLSTLVDGLAAVEALRRADPDSYRILSTVGVRFRYRDAGTALVDCAPLIEHAADGGFIGLRFSPRLDAVPLLPAEQLTEFYRARRQLDRLVRSPEFELRFLLQDGDLMMFDNRRLLHGRTEFDPQEGDRHLQGCYIDIDGPRSLYRVLQRNGAAA